MAATASHAVTVYLAGTSTPFSDVTEDVSAGVVRMFDEAYRIFDPAQPLTVEVDGNPVAEADISVDYLFGKVRWLSGTTPSGEIIVSGNYVPLWQVGEARGVSIDSSWSELDTSVQGDSAKKHIAGRMGADVSLSSLRLRRDDVDEAGQLDAWKDLHNNATPKLVSVTLGADTWRGWVTFPGLSSSMPEDDVVTTGITARTSARKAAGRNQYVSYGHES